MNAATGPIYRWRVGDVRIPGEVARETAMISPSIPI